MIGKIWEVFCSVFFFFLLNKKNRTGIIFNKVGECLWYRPVKNTKVRLHSLGIFKEVLLC